LGEPWITFFEPEALVQKLLAVGFGAVDSLTPQKANRAYFARRLDGLSIASSAYMMAARI
jgi:hypothetical protein